MGVENEDPPRRSAGAGATVATAGSFEPSCPVAPAIDAMAARRTTIEPRLTDPSPAA